MSTDAPAWSWHPGRKVDAKYDLGSGSSHKHKYLLGGRQIRHPSLGAPRTPELFYVSPLGRPKNISVRNAVHLEI